MVNPIQHITIQIPFSRTDRQLAERFAQGQPTAAKATQVYQNTLAVVAVYHYLQMLDIAADLDASHSWHAIDQLCSDAADLMVNGIGRLECRAVHPGDRRCMLPLEVRRDRIGYIVVQLDSTLRQGTILGFTPDAAEAIALDALQPLDNLLPILHPQPIPVGLERSPVQLQQWLNGIFEATWQTFDVLSGTTARPTWAFRTRQTQDPELANFETFKQFVQQLYTNHPQGISDTLLELRESIMAATSPPELVPVLAHLLETTNDDETRWAIAEALWTLEPNHPKAGIRRVLDLGVHLAGCGLALLVAVLPKQEPAIDVLVRVCPMGGAPYLPSNLELTGLDDSDTPFLTAQSRIRDNYIQLKFTVEAGERFSLKVAIEDASITQTFVG